MDVFVFYYGCVSLIFTHLDVSEHGGQVVGLGAQVKMVEDVFLHVVQVRVFNILLLSEGNSTDIHPQMILNSILAIFQIFTF